MADYFLRFLPGFEHHGDIPPSSSKKSKAKNDVDDNSTHLEAAAGAASSKSKSSSHSTKKNASAAKKQKQGDCEHCGCSGQLRELKGAGEGQSRWELSAK